MSASDQNSPWFQNNAESSKANNAAPPPAPSPTAQPSNIWFKSDAVIPASAPSVQSNKPTVPGAAPSPDQGASATFAVVLTAVGPKKIDVIKLIRQLTNVGLADTGIAAALLGAYAISKSSTTSDRTTTTYRPPSGSGGGPKPGTSSSARTASSSPQSGARSASPVSYNSAQNAQARQPELDRQRIADIQAAQAQQQAQAQAEQRRKHHGGTRRKRLNAGKVPSGVAETIDYVICRSIFAPCLPLSKSVAFCS